MRAYVFVNRYCKGIQAGIQAAHAIVELVNEHGDVDPFTMWADHHKTIVVLDGGDHENLNKIAVELGSSGAEIGTFREPGLNHAITAVAVIADEQTMNVIQYIRENQEVLDSELEERYFNDSIATARLIVNTRTHKG